MKESATFFIFSSYINPRFHQQSFDASSVIFKKCNINWSNFPNILSIDSTWLLWLLFYWFLNHFILHFLYDHLLVTPFFNFFLLFIFLLLFYLDECFQIISFFLFLCLFGIFFGFLKSSLGSKHVLH